MTEREKRADEILREAEKAIFGLTRGRTSPFGIAFLLGDIRAHLAEPQGEPCSECEGTGIDPMGAHVPATLQSPSEEDPCPLCVGTGAEPQGEPDTLIEPEYVWRAWRSGCASYHDTKIEAAYRCDDVIPIERAQIGPWEVCE